MKFNKIITLLLFAALTFGFYSCSDKKDTPEDTEKQGEVQDDAKKDGDISKEDVINFSNDLIAFMESDEFYNEFKTIMIELSKEDPKTMMDKMDSQMKEKMEAKYMKLGAKYGFKSEDDFEKYKDKYKDDPELKALEGKMMTAAMGLFKKMMNDEELMKALPAEAKAMFEMMGGAQEMEEKGE